VCSPAALVERGWAPGRGEGAVNDRAPVAALAERGFPVSDRAYRALVAALAERGRRRRKGAVNDRAYKAPAGQIVA